MSVAVIVVEDMADLRDLAMEFLDTFIEAGDLLVGKNRPILADGLQQSVGALTTAEAGSTLVLGVEDYHSAAKLIQACHVNDVPVQLMVIDGQFPGGNGPKLIKECVSPDTPWIAVTGNLPAWEANARECGLRYDPSKVLPKPYKKDALLEAIKNVIERPRMVG